MSSNVIPFRKKGKLLAARSDEELLILAAQGTSGAFEVLVRRYARRVLEYCVRHLGERQLGEEMAHELWMTVWDHRRECVVGDNFVVWLFTLLRNRVLNVRRHPACRPSAALHEAPAPIPTSDLSLGELDRMLAAERRKKLDRALAGISAQLREAVLLRFTEELPYEAMAQILDANESTVRSRVFHGLRELHRRLKCDP